MDACQLGQSSEGCFEERQLRVDEFAVHSQVHSIVPLGQRRLIASSSREASRHRVDQRRRARRRQRRVQQCEAEVEADEAREVRRVRRVGQCLLNVRVRLVGGVRAVMGTVGRVAVEEVAQHDDGALQRTEERVMQGVRASDGCLELCQGLQHIERQHVTERVSGAVWRLR